ncbi:hypothetical protein V5O48_001526 [Marasmius crinis-equi]|uniref:Uncharacterized protein n=1 Tax=Marasmius crinis-equi TaxID=585013 RepID=A0ABR3FY50_9AGAR
MDNPWANAWATSDNASTKDESSWEEPKKDDQSWIQPSTAAEPAWNPPSPKWTADEPTWTPSTPQWSQPGPESSLEPESETKEETEEEEIYLEPPASKLDDEEKQEIIVNEPVLEPAPPQSPLAALDGDAFGSFEDAQWGHGVTDATEDEEGGSPGPVDEWELARQEKAKQDEYVPPEVLAAILTQLETLSKDIFPTNSPNHDTAPKSIARDILEAVDGLEAISNQILPTSISLEPIPPFPKSWMYKKTADAVRLTRHADMAKQFSPLARYLESKGSTAWEASVKSRPELIHDDSDVMPVGWKVIDANKDKEASAPETKRKSTNILSSFFGRNKSSPVSSTRPSPAHSPRPSVDLGKPNSPITATSPTVAKTPISPPATQVAPTPTTLIPDPPSAAATVASPDIFPPEAPPPSAVSRFLGRFSRTKSNNANQSSMALSSDDLDFLSLSETDTFKTVPSALDDDDPLESEIFQNAPTNQKLPPPLAPPPIPKAIPPPPPPSNKPQNGVGKTLLSAPPALPLGLPTPTAASFDTGGFFDGARTPTEMTFSSGNSAIASKQANGGKGFGWVPPATSNGGSSKPDSSASSIYNTPSTSTLPSPLSSRPPSLKTGKRPTPVAIMSSSSSSKPTPSPRLAPPPGAAILPPPPSGQVSPPRSGPSSPLTLLDFGKATDKDTLPPLPSESYAGRSSIADDDDFADFQDSSFTSFRSASHGHSFNQSISSTSSASETSFFGGLGDSSMDSNMSGSVSGSSVGGDNESGLSDFDDFVSGLTALPKSNTGNLPPLPRLPSFTSRTVVSPPPSSPLTSPQRSSPAPQQPMAEMEAYHARTRALVDSAKGMKSWPSSSNIASPPSLASLSRQNTGNSSHHPTPISRQNTGTSPALSRQNTGNTNDKPSFPPVIMSAARQNTGTFPTAIMSSGSSRQPTTSKVSGGMLPILPGPPGFGPPPGAAKTSSPPVTMDIFGDNDGALPSKSLPVAVSPPPVVKQTLSVGNEDPLDLFGGSIGAGATLPKPSQPTTTPATGRSGGGLSAQDLSFFEGL